MLITRLLFVLFIQNVVAANAQTITIIAANTKENLPFATIQNLTAQWTQVGSENGVFTFTEANSKAGDSILISYTGYLPLRLVKPKVGITLNMEPLPYLLQLVEVLPCKGNKKVVLRNYQKNKSDWGLGSNEDALSSWAAYIPNTSKVRGIIISIHYTLNMSSTPKNGRTAPFKIRLLLYNETTNLPGDPLLYKELLVYPTGQKVEIDVRNEWLRMPENGLVIVIDYFYAGEQYVHTHKVKQFKIDGSSIDTIHKSYGASIKAVRADNMIGKGFMFQYKRNEWNTLNNSQNQKLAPKIELSLKLCD